ncbi:recombinase family protein [Streptomyces caniscabiei]|uniref:recombinase family protein n=1 Tax=Streptomyces caniscabiei TaxID=2746961 RepID=UPI0029BCD8E4|nr:recombinase family protein [Streptomyces caniscabiei]MDX2602723.1 recombinase family protein [Streptomyces caniscabiei]MDX2737990.1 recombinase family protein [Streptomyces caniscabiei]MDX2777222.1 recombinase family protein [Streptomyces caniscabiei]
MTTSPDRQRACIQLRAGQLGCTLIAEATDLGVSARKMSPFERPALSPWPRRPDAYEVIVWSHVDRAVRSVAHMSELIEWGQRHATTLVFGMPEERQPLAVTPQADGDAIRGGGLVPFGYRKAPHPSGVGWCLAPDPETIPVVRAIVDDVHSGLSLVAIAHKLETAGVLVPRDRHAQLQGRPTGGRRHGRDFDRFRWTVGSLCKILRTPALMGHRVHKGQTVRDANGAPVLIGPPVLTEAEFQALQDALNARSNGTRAERRETSRLVGVAHCAGCGGRMYFATRKAYDYGDYVCRASARGRRAPRPQPCVPAGSTSTPSAAIARLAVDGEVTRERLLSDAVRVTVAKGRSGGGPERLAGPDTSRLTFTVRTRP